ncbi:MAG: hypothetical protein JXP34_27740 [Planctomycetes bacterium]|nr:hypothetical protein [Planctomycetota bacterium]
MRVVFETLILSLPLWTAGAPDPAPDPASASLERIARILEARSISEILGDDAPDPELPAAAADAAAKLVWETYRTEATEDPARQAEHEGRALRHGDATMRYAYTRIGEKPAGGCPLYIALHGGGGAPPAVNDGQWKHMTVYYRESVKEGIYLAPRGVSDTWNLHFQGASYPLYDRLIENMILFEDVDPDRVYLLGYSAGGDGVYQVTPRMADRWAAANMSAGHHNGVNPRNLYRVPFLVQVGERDAAYNRNKETVRFAQKLDALRAENPDGYIHEIFVHADRPHNFLDNDPAETEQRVLADPAAWLEKGERAVVSRNTNAIAWLRKYRRDPYPARVIWDLKTRADRDVPFYWLDIAGRDPAALGTDEIIARYDRKANAITVEKAGSYLRILLSSAMLDLSKPIAVKVDGKTFRGSVRPSLKTMLRTVLERGDPRYIFQAACVLERRDGAWAVSGLER